MSFSADSWIHDGHVNSGGKVGQRRPQEGSPLGDGMAGHAVADVEQAGIRDDAPDNPFAGRDGRVGQTEIGQEGDEGAGHGAEY
jgi:hypothetical protein